MTFRRKLLLGKKLSPRSLQSRQQLVEVNRALHDATAITELGKIIPSRSSVRSKSHSLQPSTLAITNGFSVPWVDQEWNTSSRSSARTKWLVTGVLILTSLLLMGGPPLCSASTTIETNAGVSLGPDI